MERDLAGQVQLERDQLAAVPVRSSRIRAGRGADELAVIQFAVAERREGVARPAERRARIQRANIIGAQLDLHETAAVAVPGLANPHDVALTRFVRPAQLLAVEAHGGGRVDRHAP